MTFRTWGKAEVPAEKQSKGVHIVFAPQGAKVGLGTYLQATFGLNGEARRALYDSLQASGFCKLIPAKGGAMLYLAGDEPSTRLTAEQRAARDAKAAADIATALAPALRKLA